MRAGGQERQETANAISSRVVEDGVEVVSPPGFSGAGEEQGVTRLCARAEAEAILAPRSRRLRPWLLWLGGFYALWGAIQFFGDYWGETLANWPIALAMALGSYVAGSTPMGGGTVGFPVLALLFELPSAVGRNFGLAIQSVGMTSAGLFILCCRARVATRLLAWSVAGAAPGLVIGTLWVVPRVGDAEVKLLFACIWASFGVLTLVKNRELCGFDALPEVPERSCRQLGLAVGLSGGVTAALTGVGIDLLLYTVLVLRYRSDLRVAVPTSVLVMAATSVMGTALHLVIGDLDRGLFAYWLAASPVVIVGAPLGAFLVSVIPRLWTLYFVAALCILQFVWTLAEVPPSPGQWVFVAAILGGAGLGFAWLYQQGVRRPAGGAAVP